MKLFFPFFGAPCCEKMARWLSVQPFLGFSDLTLVHSPAQADLLLIVGRVSHKQAPVLQRVYHDLQNPTQVLHLKGCTTHLVDYASMRDPSKMLHIDQCISNCPIAGSQIRAALDKL
jgi:NADH-quinone oxidoreductase subunit B